MAAEVDLHTTGEGETVIFVDLAGFTALTEAHGDQHAADLADALTDLARTALSDGDQLVKSIGDAVLLTSATPRAAVHLVTTMVRDSHRNQDFLDLRAGLHHGPVIHRRGDVFGATVNVAARVAGMATAGQVLCTPDIADDARACGIAVFDLGLTSMRNVAAPVHLFALDVAAPRTGLVDPVCRMRVRPENAIGTLRHAGATYAFCSLRCAGLFAQNPDRY